jgi:CTP synthase
MSCKYVIVAGGVYSGTGKGISAASLGLLLSMRGLKVQPIKFDPYLNINAGVLAPREHGEVFLCDDGSETDLDLGHYERIIGTLVSAKNIATSGTLHKELIQEQEDGKYLGKTVQIIPHLTDKIQERLTDLGKDADVVIAEIGGTVGDIESGSFYKAISQFKQKMGDDCRIMLVSPIIWVKTIKEFKTKPLQQSVQQLQSYGIQPDIVLCRVDREVPAKMLDKVSDLTGVIRSNVFDAPDVKAIYEVPLIFHDRHIDDLVVDMFRIKRNGCRIFKYRELVEKYLTAEDMPEVNIAIVGKYADNADEAYLSLKEAVYHAAVANNVRANIKWINAEDLEKSSDSRGVWRYFDGIDGVIVPGGFDSRGVAGKIRAIRYVREKKIPFLGICLGLQCSVIEFSRNVLGLSTANSLEFDTATVDPVVHWVEGQEHLKKKCGNMRLGAFACELKNDSLAAEVYGKTSISERHRHRYEVNNKYVETLAAKGFNVVGRHLGLNENDVPLVEVMELDRNIHPYFIGTQAHPEFKSRLGSPAPLFEGLVKAICEVKNFHKEPLTV